MDFVKLFAFCKKHNIDISVRRHGTEYYLRIRRGDRVADQIFDECALELLKDPNEMITERIEELLEEWKS